MSVIRLFDSDGSNPYSRELRGVLSSGGYRVEFFGPSDLAGINRPLRPRFRPRTALDGLGSEVVATLAAAFGRTPVLIAWARTYQKALFAVGARVRRRPTFVVVHNPSRDRWPRGIRGLVEILLLRASTCVTHSEALREALMALAGLDSRVAPHPLYLEWVRQWVPESPAASGSSPKFLLLGRLAPEKFEDVDSLFAALEASPSRSSVRVLTRPRLPHVPPCSHVEVDDRSNDSWIPDADIGDALAWADVLLAPYPGVTESGTIQLALSAGVGVAAFDGGALRDSLTDCALVPVGDYAGLVRSAFAIAQGEVGSARVPLDERKDGQVAQWASALSDRITVSAANA